jgi:hypothetical protein
MVRLYLDPVLAENVTPPGPPVIRSLVALAHEAPASTQPSPPKGVSRLASHVHGEEPALGECAPMRLGRPAQIRRVSRSHPISYS